MSDHSVLILHGDDDLSELAEVRTHLAPLSRLGAIELVSAAELAQAPDGMLVGLLREADGLVVALTAPVLALPELLEDRIRESFAGPIEFLSLGSCAHRLVPWIAEADLIPADGRLLDDLDRRDRDAALSAMVYRLADAIVSVESKNEDGAPEAVLEAEPDLEDPVEEEIELDIEPLPVEAEPAAPAEVAAGPGTKAEAPVPKVEEALDPALAELGYQFDETCAAVLPEDGLLDDDALAALIELALVLGDARKDLGDDEGQVAIHRHASRSLLRLLRDRETASEFANDVAVVLEDALEVEENVALSEAFRDLLDGAPQPRG